MDNKTKKEKVMAVLQSIESGDPAPFSYINPGKYIQHNLMIPDGLEGIASVVQNKPAGGFKAKVVRVFEDGDYVFAHTEYDFFGPKIGFDIFRFEDGLIVEHWDNLIETAPRNRSGRTQTDGETSVQDVARTEANKQLVKNFIEDNWIGNKQNSAAYVNPAKYIQHNSLGADGLDNFLTTLQAMAQNGIVMYFTKIHKILGEGNFALAMSEGRYGSNGGLLTSFYDLFRLEDGKIVEHWDVIEPIPPREQWRNNNGKF
ncbi:MAG: nuclear transport factor 2 family protein [Anaerolineae bacterium]